MKTKQEVSLKIEKIRQEKKHARDLSAPDAYIDLLRIQTLTLQWVLGYKIKPYYWCWGCQHLHQSLRCPWCGGDNEVRTVEKTMDKMEQPE